ncbi:hypothetical protein [Mesorhizobium sp. ES1-1]|uniref:hypothetical protein n=1 Tax=Mesorhizobium sp. ES1-1 TaxID=2876629 RepID=UPI001CCF138D|nr:hypothetical protein [Mesorhizobium sp. ES1-1]MBZ9676964.1 hypothetical protein [Mesorhizobium sp. ES1-1]
MALFALAARAADSSDPNSWNPETWTIQRLLDDGLSEMRFVIVRSNASGCEPNCPEWISAEGAIEAGTPAKLKRLLKGLRPRRLPIIVNSPGGNVDAALQLGRIIRKAKLDIAVGKTSFSRCQPGAVGCPADAGKGVTQLGVASDGGAMCNSACPLMFAGGTQRLVGRWAYLGVHQITSTFQRQQVYYRTTYRMVHGRKKIISSKVISRTNLGTYQTYEMSKALEKKLSGYLKEMGVGRGVVDLMKVTPAGDIRQISLEEMTTTNLVTSKGAVDLLVWGGICRRSPAPANCREIPANVQQPAFEVKATPSETVIAADRSSNAEGRVSQLARGAEIEQFQGAAGNSARQMRIVVVRGSDPLCEPDCPEWISAEGAITLQATDKLRHMLIMIGDRRLPVVISSRGGDLFSALTMGRLIRERKLDVVVARTNVTGCRSARSGCSDDNGGYVGLISEFGVECDSACALVLAGGVKRLVDSKARLSMYAMEPIGIVKAYLEAMSANPLLFAEIKQQSLERQFEPKFALRVGLTTGPQSADVLTGPAICKSVPRPSNCRVWMGTVATAKTP